MEQSPSCEANSHFATQQFPRILWKKNVNYPVEKGRHCSLT
jgi:hypothetical protein